MNCVEHCVIGYCVNETTVQRKNCIEKKNIFYVDDLSPIEYGFNGKQKSNNKSDHLNFKVQRYFYAHTHTQYTTGMPFENSTLLATFGVKTVVTVLL